MADRKTHLRELSVAVGVAHYSGTKVIDENQIYNSKYFYNVAIDIVGLAVKSASNILDKPIIDGDCKIILVNGFKLAKALCEVFKIKRGCKIIWAGFDTQKNDPVDLYINEIGISLKEESYILENMGLYKYLSLITKNTYKRGLHIFKTYASREYDEWFLYTWKHLINAVKRDRWVLDDSKHNSEIYIQHNSIMLSHNRTQVSKVPFDIKGIADFEKHTSSKTREHVFAKWIANEISLDEKYLSLKNKCSSVAGENLCIEIKENLDCSNLARLLQFYDKGYYYAKTTATHLHIFEVPASKDFSKIIEIEKVYCEIPVSQLNIYTIFKNKITNRQLIIRNECRFSHGQFNGTPEAKMYYDRRSDLDFIYIPVK